MSRSARLASQWFPESAEFDGDAEVELGDLAAVGLASLSQPKDGTSAR